MKALYLILIHFIILTGPVFSHAESGAFVLTTIKGSVNSQPSLSVLKEAYDQLGIKISVTFYPAERSLVMANKGFADGEVHRISGIEKSYENLIMIPHPIGRFEACVFPKQPDLTVNGWESLSPYRIGILKGSKFSENRTETMDRIRAYTPENLLILLSENRITVAVLGCMTGKALIKKLDLKGITPLAPPLISHEIYHYVHKKHRNLVPKLVTILSRMDQKGRILAIWETYFKTL